MPLPGWNDDFSIIPGEEWASLVASPDFFEMFWAAYLERWKVVQGTTDTSPASVGADATNAWKTLQTKVISVAASYLGPYTPATGDLAIRSARHADFNYPESASWTREYPRTITAIANGGTDGWRARFEASASVGVTPSNERHYSGQIFDRVSGAWVLSTDQISNPNHVIVTGKPEVATAGDYFTGEWCNRLRDAINQLMKTIYMAQGNPIFPTTISFPWLRYYVSAFSGGGPTATDSWNNNNIPASYDSFDQATVASFSTRTSPDDSTHRVLHRKVGPFTNGTTLPNPDNLSRTATFWIRARKPYAWSFGSTSIFTYDDQGDGFIEDEYENVGSQAAFTDNLYGALDGPFLGQAFPASPPTPDPTALAVGETRGYTIYDAGCIFDWTGSFAYDGTT